MDKQVPKEIVTDDGHIYQLKRPLHKQGWFWVSLGSWIVSGILFLTLIGFFILNTVLVANGGNLQQFWDGGSYYQNSDSYEEHVVGDSATLDNGAKLTISSIQQDKNRTLADDGTGRAIVVRVKLENKTPKAITLNPYYFSLFDYVGNVYVLDTSTFDQTAWTQKIEPGKSVDLELVFDGEGNEEDNYNLIYDDLIRWWQDRTSLASDDGRL